jgi:hypothetical protein
MFEMDLKIERLCAALFLAAKDHREIMMNSVFTDLNFENVGAIITKYWYQC